MRPLGTGRLLALQARSTLFVLTAVAGAVVLPGPILSVGVAATCMVAAVAVERLYNLRFAEMLRRKGMPGARRPRGQENRGDEAVLDPRIHTLLAVRSALSAWRLLWPLVVLVGITPVTLFVVALMAILMVLEYVLLVLVARMHAKQQREGVRRQAALQA